MSDQPAAGDRIKVVLEGTVIDDSDKLGRFVMLTDEPKSEAQSFWQVSIRGPLVKSVEVIRPHYQPGDVVAVEYGQGPETYAMLPDGTWLNVSVRHPKPFQLSDLGFQYPHRLIARGGKPVQ